MVSNASESIRMVYTPSRSMCSGMDREESAQSTSDSPARISPPSYTCCAPASRVKGPKEEASRPLTESTYCPSRGARTTRSALPRAVGPASNSPSRKKESDALSGPVVANRTACPSARVIE